MALANYKLIWLKQLQQELKFEENSQIHLLCHNQAQLRIASNFIFQAY